MKLLLETLIDPPEEGTTTRSKLAATPLHVWLLLLGLTCALFSGWWGQLGIPIGLDRVLIPLAMLLVLLDQRRPRQRMTAVHWSMGAFVLWILIDMVLRGTLDQSVQQFALLDRVILPFAMFLIAPLVFDTPFRRDLLLIWSTLVGAYLGVTAILEVFAPSLVFPSYIADFETPWYAVRAKGPMMGPDAMGVAGVALGSLAVVATVRFRGALRVWSAATLPLCGASVLLSGTRATWVGAAAALLTVAILVPAARRWVAAATAAGAAVLAGVFLAFPELLVALVDRTSQRGPVYDRLGSNDAAMALLADLPLTGIGWRRFYPHGSEWFRQSDAYPTNAVIIEIHNVVLSRATELGLIAAVPFLVILILGPGRPLWESLFVKTVAASAEADAWRVVAAAVFASWFVSGLFGPLAIPFPNFLTFAVCGIASAGYLARDRTPPLAGER